MSAEAEDELLWRSDKSTGKLHRRLVGGRRMATTQTSLVIQARCPHCGRCYGHGASRFLYSDEHGVRCPECGSILVYGLYPSSGGYRTYRLIIPKRFEGSELHRRLEKLARKEGATVVVERTNSYRTFGLED